MSNFSKILTACFLFCVLLIAAGCQKSAPTPDCNGDCCKCCQDNCKVGDMERDPRKCYCACKCMEHCRCKDDCCRQLRCCKGKCDIAKKNNRDK